MNSLQMDKSMTIKPSDKGGSVVLWDNVIYCTAAMKQLNDRDCYETSNLSAYRQFKGFICYFKIGPS